MTIRDRSLTFFFLFRAPFQLVLKVIRRIEWSIIFLLLGLKAELFRTRRIRNVHFGLVEALLIVVTRLYDEIWTFSFSFTSPSRHIACYYLVMYGSSIASELFKSLHLPGLYWNCYNEIQM